MENAVDIKNLLEWYLLAGVDETCGDSCYQAKKKPQDIPPSPLRQATTTLSQNVIASKQNARDLCQKASSLSELKQIALDFDGCALKLTAKSTVFGAGNEKARLMFIGEAPGTDEDRAGLPFVGPSGRLLDKMIEAIGLQRSDVYITNVVMWRPPGNRTPTDAEVSVCLPFLKRQIELVSPEIIVFLGGSAANALLDNTDSISRLRGRWLEYQTTLTNSILATATFHPAHLLRNPAQKAKVWADFLRILKKLKEN